MIILSYNKRTGAIKMVSVLRDSLVPIEDRGWNRINAAYSFDGVGLAVNTVNQLFDLDIQRFVVVDFNGVTDFIDKAGGVTISLTKAEVDYMTRYSNGAVSYNIGPNKFNGDRALVYMRIRKILTSVIGSVATKAAVSGLNMESQHVPYSDDFTYKYYNGMAIISFNIDDAARRVNRFIYG